jgi:hypothetical protein
MNDVLLQTWKAQLDSGMRLLESITEGAIRLHQAQLEAATEAHAEIEATRKAVAGATDAAQLMTLCAESARATAEKSFARWRSLVQAPEGPLGMFKLDTIDGAYKQWLETLQGVYRPVAKAGS